MTIPVATLPPDPGPMPTQPPGVPPPPPPAAPPQGPPGAAGPQQAGAGAPPQPGDSPPGPAGPGAPPSPGAAPDPSQQQVIRPRLIPGSDATEGTVPASPEEQQEFQQVMIKAGQMIHSRMSRDQVLSSLHAPQETVAQAVGRTAAQILMTIDQQKQAVTKQPLSPDVLQEAARYVVPELMDLGIHAGLFPIQPPPGGLASDQKGIPPGAQQDPADQQQGPGVGTDPYNREIRMAMLEATKIYGESLLQKPNGPQLTQQAQNMWAQKVRQEVASGTASPRYMAIVQPKNQQGSPALINQQQGQQPPPDQDEQQGAPNGGMA